MKNRVFQLALAFLLLAALGAAQAPAAGSYRVQLWIHSSQAGKAGTASTYTLQVEPGVRNSSIQTGERVPVRAGSSDVSYQRVGVSLDCRLDASAKGLPTNEIGVDLQVSLNTIVPNSPPMQPAFASTDSHVVATVPIGQRVLVAQFEDAATHATYQLEVQASPAAPTAASSQANSNAVSRNRS